MTAADNTLDAASIEVDLDFDHLESNAPADAPSAPRFALITYPLIAALAAFAAVGVLQLGPRTLQERAQVLLHAEPRSTPEVVSTPVIVRPPSRAGSGRQPEVARSIDERVARATPRSEDHARRLSITTAVVPAIAAATPPPPSPVSRGARGPATTSLGISGTPNADDVAAANAILQKAKGERSF